MMSKEVNKLDKEEENVDKDKLDSKINKEVENLEYNELQINSFNLVHS